MKNTLILLTILFTISSCKVKEKPEFINVQNIKVTDSNSKFITLTADALFKNPNSIGGQIKTGDIKVFVDEKQLATVTSENFKVPARKEFTIPLQAIIETKTILSDGNLGSLLNSLLNKKMKVQYVGDIKYKLLGFTHTYKIDKTEDVKIKL